MPAEATIDPGSEGAIERARAEAIGERSEAFAEQVMLDYAGASACFLGAIGDALGLFKELSSAPATSEELAERAGVDERYAREWLAGVHAAGYITVDRATGRYALPAEHAPVLAEEGDALFLGAAFRNIVAKGQILAPLLRVFREGGGIPVDAFSDDKRATIARHTAARFETALVQEWIPRLPALVARLQDGASVADVGCGRGLALIRLAQAYPRSRFVGYDLDEGEVALATEAARKARVADRVRFEIADAAAGLPGRFDIVFTFDVIHDAVDPTGILLAIRRALADGGRYVCVDVNCEERPEDNVGPLATIRYAASLGYCLTISLAEGGAGLGACGLSMPVLRRLATDAGFRRVRRVPTDDRFNAIYELIP
jgi:ubiquinone/menaquinone biosynthesis C-methylase UbiE